MDRLVVQLERPTRGVEDVDRRRSPIRPKAEKANASAWESDPVVVPLGVPRQTRDEGRAGTSVIACEEGGIV
jgi:hypothetical protein